MDEKSGHISVDFYPPTLGNSIFPGSNHDINRLRLTPKLVGYIEGDELSLSKSMIDFVENNYLSYPHKFSYHYVPGPNSNTFTRWIINKFPESGLKLPWNAFGW